MKITEEKANVLLELAKDYEHKKIDIRYSNKGDCDVDGDQVSCQGYTINLKTLDVTNPGTPPPRLVLIRNGTRQEAHLQESYTLYLYETKDGYKSFIIDNIMANVLYIRLFTGEKVEGFNQVFESNKPERVVVLKLETK